jgi:hypothetical protein
MVEFIFPHWVYSEFKNDLYRNDVIGTTNGNVYTILVINDEPGIFQRIRDHCPHIYNFANNHNVEEIIENNKIKYIITKKDTSAQVQINLQAINCAFPAAFIEGIEHIINQKINNENTITITPCDESISQLIAFIQNYKHYNIKVLSCVECLIKFSFKPYSQHEIKYTYPNSLQVSFDISNDVYNNKVFTRGDFLSFFCNLYDHNTLKIESINNFWAFVDKKYIERIDKNLSEYTKKCRIQKCEGKNKIKYTIAMQF